MGVEMYKVIFEDGTTFDGGTPINSLWSELPNKPIKSVEYWVTDKLHFLFEGFEEYNHCVERVRGVNLPLDIATKAIIMARIAQRVYQVIFDLKRGTIYQLVVPWGEEYSPQEVVKDGEFKGWENGKPLSGWRQGLFNTGYPGPKLKKINLD